MKNILALLVLGALTGNACAQQDSWRFAGNYSNMKWSRSAHPHLISGYSVTLYRNNDQIDGDIAIAVGAEEAVHGRLHDVKFDPATGSLRFKSKYSAGSQSDPGKPGKDRDTRDLLSFTGKMNRQSLTGTMVTTDGYRPDAAATTARVAIRKQKDYEADRYEEWRKYRSKASDW